MGRLIIILLIGLHVLDTPDFLTERTMQSALCYSFFHASWWHLAVNCIAIWGLFKTCKPCTDLLYAYFIAVLVAPLSSLPPIGFSNIIYAMIGLRTPALSSPWWRKPIVLFFLFVTVAMIPIPQVAGLTHTVAFALGVGCASLKRFYHKLTGDVRRYL